MKTEQRTVCDRVPAARGSSRDVMLLTSALYPGNG